MIFSINPKKVIVAMLIIIAGLAALHMTQLIIYFWVADEAMFDFIRLLDFDYEANLPSFYSALAIVFCSILLFIIGIGKNKEWDAFRFHWIGLAFIFVFLGVDEAVGLHEEIGDLLERQKWFEAKGALYFAWVVPYSLLLLLFSVSYFRFLLSLPRHTMMLFLGAGSLFVIGAVGVEVISASEADLHGTETVYYSVLYTIEELCEMTGIAIFAYALLRYLENLGGNIQVQIQSV